MTGCLIDKVALVTGGGLGIGRSTARAFAREGAKVVVADKDDADGKETVRLIKETAGEAIFVKTDVARADDVEAMVEAAVEVYGRLDCAFNNAGIQGPVYVRTADFSEEDWDRVIGVNLKGVWLCLKYEISQMLVQGKGTIVNMSSAAGLVGGSIVGPAYVASKHGVVGLTRASALEYGKQSIRVNAVCPGLILTRMGQSLFTGDPEIEKTLIAQHPVGRVGTPSEVAEAVIWLCSDAASFVTGQALAVDGGYVAQ
jgi:NAD(P)-dependent dehydrogenase (short-subunit alcohol dehydrogenase family)